MKQIKWEKYNFIDDDIDEESEFGNTMRFVLPGQMAQKKFIENFDFWLGHCNFKITRSFFNELDETDGVEALNYITPYRFVIAIGKSFDQKGVMQSIDSMINDEPNLPEELIDDLDFALNETHGKDSVICILPNGVIDFTCVDDKDFQEKIDIFKEVESDVGGMLIYNE